MIGVKPAEEELEGEVSEVCCDLDSEGLSLICSSVSGLAFKLLCRESTRGFATRAWVVAIEEIK